MQGHGGPGCRRVCAAAAASGALSARSQPGRHRLGYWLWSARLDGVRTSPRTDPQGVGRTPSVGGSLRAGRPEPACAWPVLGTPFLARHQLRPLQQARPQRGGGPRPPCPSRWLTCVRTHTLGVILLSLLGGITTPLHQKSPPHSLLYFANPTLSLLPFLSTDTLPSNHIPPSLQRAPLRQAGVGDLAMSVLPPSLSLSLLA